jgi:hypothetical protein
MDIEQLKLILETLQSVGHEASSLTMLWMWLKFGAAILNVVFWGIIIVGVAHAIGRAWRALEGDTRADRFLRDMRDVLGTGTGGCLTEVEYDRTTSLLRRLAEEYRAQKKDK